MAKRKNATSGKGFLEIDWESDKARLTTVTKDEEFVYDFFEILNEYNNKQISFSIAEDVEIEPIED